MSEEETKYLNNVASQIMEQTDPRGYGCVSYDWLTGKIKEAYEQGRVDALKELAHKSLEGISCCTGCQMRYPECGCSDDGPLIYALVEKIEEAKERAYQQGNADALKELMKGEPDGWCFHHDKLGWFWKEPEDPYHKEEMQRLGYEIVPVKLVKMEVSG